MTRLFLLLALLACTARAQTPVDVVSELERLVRIDRLPAYRPHGVAAQVSSYDTTGGNNDGFGGLYSFVRREGGHLVLADLEGPGVVTRMWTPTPTTDTLAFYFDGEPAPRLRLPFIDVFSGNRPPFVEPVAGHEIGGYYSYLPIPYARSLKIVFEGERILFHQIQYRRFTDGRPVTSFPAGWPPAAEAALERVRALWRSFGSPLGHETLAPDREVQVRDVEASIGPGDSAEILHREGGGRIVGLEIEAPYAPFEALRSVLLEAVWDDEERPAVRVPLTDVFGYGYGAPSMQGLLAGVRDGLHYVYLPMPFDHRAVLRLVRTERAGDPEEAVPVRARVLYTDAPRDPEAEGRLYAVWRREVDPAEGEPYLLLDARGRGHHVGTILRAQGRNPGMTVFFEGDDVATVDGEMRLHGTGSEDYFNGGWYALVDRWDRGISLPLHGSLDYSVPMARTGGYRFYLADKVSFDRSYHLTIEHGPEGNAVPVDYTSVAFTYGDTPPRAGMDPAEASTADTAPSVHEFYPQLMRTTLGWGATLDFSNRRDLVVAGTPGDIQPEGMVRIDLREVPNGRYRVLLSYVREPDGAPFSLWQRQERISAWTPSQADTEERVARAAMGELTISDLVHTVTVRVRLGEEGRSFRFDRLVLERLEE